MGMDEGKLAVLFSRLGGICNTQQGFVRRFLKVSAVVFVVCINTIVFLSFQAHASAIAFLFFAYLLSSEGRNIVFCFY